MSVLVILLASLVLIGPLRSHEHYRLVFETEKHQMALDNAAIRLGRMDRRILNAVAQTEKILKGLHLAYHASLACSLIPKAAPVCGVARKYLGRTIRQLQQRVSRALPLFWRVSPVGARAEAARLGVALCGVQRPSSAPLKKKRCQLCGLPKGWRFQAYGFRLRDCPGRLKDCSVKGRVFFERGYQYALYPE